MKVGSELSGHTSVTSNGTIFVLPVLAVSCHLSDLTEFTEHILVGPSPKAANE
jgi:hypothetical protein